MKWDPNCYGKFRIERQKPVEDLFKLINIRKGMGVVDLGCGTGEITEMISNLLPGSTVLGIDSSFDMLAKAKERERPDLQFERGSIEDVSGEWDLIFSNASLHWVNNHDALIPKLFSHIRKDGQLVVQIPSNHNHPSQALLATLAQEDPFKQALKGWARRSPVLSIDRYAELLFISGGSNVTVFEKVYPHVLNDADSIIEWIRGTALLPYLEGLPEKIHEQFIDKYRVRLLELWPKGPIFFPFRRIIFAASRL